MLCREIMTPNPEYVLPSDPVMKAAQLMKSEDVGPIPIVDDKDGKRQEEKGHNERRQDQDLAVLSTLPSRAHGVRLR